jgi:DNA (cytosine-5)-methyltransferase 1
MRPTVLSLCSGGGGFDVGFEQDGFEHLGAMDIDPWSVKTLKANRPAWSVTEGDVRTYRPPPEAHGADVLIAGVPCQGFSLGGNRDPGDERNTIFLDVIRVARETKPRVVVIENVLNLRTMMVPGTSTSFADYIVAKLSDAGYWVTYDIFKMCHFGVPQTRRRIVFVGFLRRPPKGYHLPTPGQITSIRPYLYELGQGGGVGLPNHDPAWGFKSAVHEETGGRATKSDAVPVRFSRTASDGHPVRSFDEPFPAVDTATVWGWAQGNVSASRVEKDRRVEKYIRNPDATVPLWRVTASRLRTFTHREYARLQTFPDDWEFIGSNKRSIHLQVGNAVPVKFAAVLAANVRAALDALRTGKPFHSRTDQGAQLNLLA